MGSLSVVYEVITTVDAAELVGRAVGASKSENTRRAYVLDGRRFDRWCTTSGHQVLPADPLVVAAYVAEAAELLDEAGARAYAPATATLSGIRRTYAAGDRPVKRVAPLLAEDVVAMVTAVRQTAAGWAGQVYERWAAPCC